MIRFIRLLIWSLDDLLAISDVVCVMAPLTDETYHMCDEAFFQEDEEYSFIC